MDRPSIAMSDPLADSLSSLSLYHQSSTQSDSISTEPPANTSLERPNPISSESPSSPLPDSPPLPNQTFVLFQPSCIKHRYIRAQHDISEIVERPERIRAITAGVAASWVRNEQFTSAPRWTPSHVKEEVGDDELGNLMKSLSIGNKGTTDEGREIKGSSSPFDILSTSSQLPLTSPALQLIHSLPNTPPYPLSATPSPEPSSPSKRTSLRSSSPSKPHPSTSSSTPWPQQLVSLISSIPPVFPTTPPTSEIPEHLPQGDLYLCRESREAIFGALGAVARGVDLVVEGTRKGKGKEKEEEGYRNGFVVVRPPGHHCGEANPQGFCFVNNVAVAAAHAYLEHGINKVIILDIDLHHGNGTQEIVWKINETANSILLTHEAREQQRLNSRSSPRKSNSPSKAPLPPPLKKPKPLQIMYGSLHDVLSFPCESGDSVMVQAASLNISGPHDQYISNIHLEPYSDERDFMERLWPRYWEGLGGKAEEFLKKSGATREETVILVSTGFDASPHEYSSMSRHGLNVPTSFYSLFSRRIKRFAEEHAQGRLLFVLEGGYSDKALVSGSMGILEGLLHENEGGRGGGSEKDFDKVVKVCGLGEKVNGGKAGGRKAGKQEEVGEEWIKRTKEVFDYLTQPPAVSNSPTKSGPKPLPVVSNGVSGVGGGMGPRQGLRERKQRVDYAGLADMPPSFSTSNANSPQQQTPSTSASALPPPIPSSTPTAFAAIPPASFFSSTTTNANGESNPLSTTSGVDGETGDGEKKKPSVKFVWKQGGIGGSAKDEPRM